MRKSQFWQLDFIVSAVIISGALSIFIFAYAPAQTTDLHAESVYISNTLMTLGVPSNWTNTTVAQVGLLAQDWTLDSTKVLQMYQLPANTLRVRLGTSEKFYIQLISNNTPFNISGSIGAGYVPNATQQISVASRFAVYNSTATEIRVQVWR